MKINEGTKINFTIFVFLLLALFSTPASAVQIDQDNIENITEQLTQFNRMSGVKDNKAAAYIKDKMEDYGLNTHLDDASFETTTMGIGKNAGNIIQVNTSNVVGIKEGKTDQIIVIGAHYDTLSPEHPGADDNAGGVAVMLELARVFQNESFNRTVYFISYSGEEFGLLGSKSWLEENDNLKDDIVAVVNLDCVASGDRLFMYTLNQHSWLLDAFTSKPNLQKHVDFITFASDEWSFWEENLPAVSLRDHGSHGFWDTPNDTIDKLNFSLAKESAEIVATGVSNLSTIKDLTPPELSIEVNNGTIHYDLSEESSINVLVDGTNFGHIESGKITLPLGEHEVKVVAVDKMGNKVSEVIAADINQTYYAIPDFEGKSAIIIPEKRTEEEIKNYGVINIGTLFHSLDYKIVKNTSNVTVTGFIDDIRIEDFEGGCIVVFSPGNHTFKVAAFNESGLIGFDKDMFSHEKCFSRPRAYPSHEEESNFINKIFNMLDAFKQMII
ncbi:MAG: M28 family metallopeptidase [Methanolobus sp.]|nr:M28 family metallopeptidase [Methanolobus sp.]